MTAELYRDERPGRVHALERAIGLLELVAVDEPTRLLDLAGRSALPYTTVHRLVHAMVALGYLRTDGARRVRLGPRAAWLGERARQRIAVWAEPHLRGLVAATGETALLATVDDNDAVLVAVVQSRRAVRAEHEVSIRMRPHCTAVGKALLAQQDDASVERFLKRTGVEAFTDKTVVDVHVLLRQLADVRRLGYAVADGEWEAGVRCVAAPVRCSSGRFAVAVSGPSGRLLAMPESQLVASVLRAAAAIVAERAS